MMVPVHYIHASYVRSHFNSIEIGIQDAPKPREILFSLVMGTGGRVHLAPWRPAQGEGQRRRRPALTRAATGLLDNPVEVVQQLPKPSIGPALVARTGLILQVDANPVAGAIPVTGFVHAASAHDCRRDANFTIHSTACPSPPDRNAALLLAGADHCWPGRGPRAGSAHWLTTEEQALTAETYGVA